MRPGPGPVRPAGAPITHSGRHASGMMCSYRPNLDGNRWHYRPGVAAGAIPTHGADARIFAATSESRFATEVRGGARAAFRRLLTEAAPELAARLRPSGRPPRLICAEPVTLAAGGAYMG